MEIKEISIEILKKKKLKAKTINKYIVLKKFEIVKKGILKRGNKK